MRITSGLHKGRILNSPKDNKIRPTSDKVRQAIFNSLESNGAIQGARVLDAFCGTGALGLEALSRGAETCDLYDISRQSLGVCKSNVDLLKEDQRTKLISKSILNITMNDDEPPYTLIFLDPPYDKGLVEQAINVLYEKKWMNEDTIFVIEAGKNENISSAHIDIFSTKIYGDTQVLMARAVL